MLCTHIQMEVWEAARAVYSAAFGRGETPAVELLRLAMEVDQCAKAATGFAGVNPWQVTVE